MGFLAPKTESPTLPTEPLMAAPASAPKGSKPGKRSAQPTFLGADAAPSASMPNSGGKTLLGQ